MSVGVAPIARSCSELGERVVDDQAAVEARIAESLLPLARARLRGGEVDGPPPYVRRHVVEHASAGGCLDDRFLSREFLPFVDAGRLRPLLRGLASGVTAAAEVARVWPRVAHCWEWDSPASNADAFEFAWSAVGGRVSATSDHLLPRLWNTRWAQCEVGPSEIVGRHTGPVGAVAVAVVGGRPVAVTGGDDGTVRVWDLGSGTPIGAPLLHPHRLGVGGV